MADKKILIVESDLLQKIDDNRGELSRSEFINFLLNNQLGDETSSSSDVVNQYVSREAFPEFTQGMKDLLRRFLDFFIAYGMELSQEPRDSTFNELVQKLQSLSASSAKNRPAK